MRRFSTACIFLSVLSLFLSGCLYYGPHRTSLKKPDDPTPARISYFDYIRDPTFPSPGDPTNWGLYQVQSFILPMSIQTGVKQMEYRLYYYLPKGPGPFPAVVILPITRGDYYTQNFAIYLAERGYACLRFESTRNFTDDAHKTLKSAEQLLRHYIIDVRRAIDWLAAREEIDSSRLGILGISLGALVASVVMEVDPRIRSGVFLLGGADLAGIIESSQERSLSRFRQRVIHHEGLAPDRFREEASRILKPVDPMTYASRLDSSKILMINGTFDQVIPSEYVEAFWNASGQPEMVFIPTGHYSAGLLVAYARAKSAAHFRRTLP